VKYFISLAFELKELKNIYGMKAIVSGLINKALGKLEYLWCGNHKKDFNNLNNYMTLSGYHKSSLGYDKNGKNYLKKMSDSEINIPDFGLIMKAITLLCEQSPFDGTLSLNTDIINKLNKILSNIAILQSKLRTVSNDASITGYINNLVINNDSELWEKSIKLIHNSNNDKIFDETINKRTLRRCKTWNGNGSNEENIPSMLNIFDKIDLKDNTRNNKMEKKEVLTGKRKIKTRMSTEKRNKSVVINNIPLLNLENITNTDSVSKTRRPSSYGCSHRLKKHNSVDAIQNFYPKSIRLWTVSDVSIWLVSIGFEKCKYTFENNEVDGDCLLRLTRDDLKELVDSIIKIGPRAKLYDEIQKITHKFIT
jgi:hypothetical protein